MRWESQGRQHWLIDGYHKGMVYEVNPESYSVYLETNAGPYTREFVCTMPTLDEAKDLLQTLAGAEL